MNNYQFQNIDTIERGAVFGSRHRPQERSHDFTVPDQRSSSREPSNRGPFRRGPSSRGPHRPVRGRAGSANRRPDTAEGGSERLEAWRIFDIILDDYRGKAKLKDIRLLFPSRWGDDEVKQWLDNDPGQRFSAFVENSGRLKFVSVHCRARLCIYYGQGHCGKDDCVNFHYCRSFLAGHCKMGRNCRHFHTFDDDHNKQLKRKLHLGRYENPQMKLILKHSIPQVCSNYNGVGCNMDDACTFLHICKEFVMKECGNEDCTLDHTFDSEHTLRLLRMFRLDRMASNNTHLRKNIMTRKDFEKESKPEIERVEVRKVHPRDSSDDIARAAKPKAYEREPSVNDDEETSVKENRPNGPGKRTRRMSGSHNKASASHPVVANAHKARGSSSEAPESPKATSDVTEEIWLKPSQRYSSGENATSPPDPVGIREDKPKYQPVPDLMGIRVDKPTYKPIADPLTIGEDYKPIYQPVLDGSKVKKKPVVLVNKPSWSKGKPGKADANLPVFLCEKQLSRKACEADCKDYHCNKRYAWFAFLDGAWQQFNDMEEDALENAYFNPTETSWNVQIKGTQAILNLDTMEASVCHSAEGAGLSVRRLAPQSSKWQWYMSKRANHFSELSENLSNLFEQNFAGHRDSFQFTRSSGKTFLVNFLTNTLTIFNNKEAKVPFTGPIKRRPRIC